MDIGRYDMAVEDFNKLIKINPHLAESYSCRGSAYTALERYDMAVEDLTEAIRLGDPWGYYERAQVYRSIGDNYRAITDFESFIELSIDPELEQGAKKSIDSLRF
jgi:tetratricopeptide (TPR) repeat protein